MRRSTRSLIILALAWVVIVIPKSVLADDCSNLQDCWGVITAALLAMLAIALLITALIILFPEILGLLGLGDLFLLEEAAVLEELAIVEEVATAEEAVALEEAAAESRLQSLASKVNPLYDTETGAGTKNCSWAAREVDQGLADMFAGRTPEPYAPDWFNPDFGPDAAIRDEFAGLSNDASFEAEYGSSFQRSSMQAIADQLQAAGNGARGLVGVTNGSTSHIFNAVNYGGEVFFIDGQTGAVWTNTQYMSGYAANSVVEFLPTAGF